MPSGQSWLWVHFCFRPLWEDEMFTRSFFLRLSRASSRHVYCSNASCNAAQNPRREVFPSDPAVVRLAGIAVLD